ncbi:MAG: hypothetical protein KIS77_01550 [Saprospiraceae bacterium]|nr:hypothetical protein [Saprospiraceae bacterium]
MKKSIFFAVVLSISFSSCCDALELCDLLIRSFQSPHTVTVGEVFNVVANIGNDEADTDCDTDIANVTTSLIEIFRKSISGDWELIESVTKSQPAVDPGGTVPLPSSITISQAGDYRFDYYTDDTDSVRERNENNNKGCAGCKTDRKAQMRQTNNYASIEIRVLPLSDGTTQIEGKPVVEVK